MSLYFQAEHPHIAEDIIKSIKQQAWYLTQELAILSLFNKEMLYEDRRYIADTLLAIPVPAAFVPGKPSFQINILDADSTIVSYWPDILVALPFIWPRGSMALPSSMRMKQ